MAVYRASTVRLGAVQGNIVPGFRTSFQGVILARFPSQEAIRRWLRALPQVTDGQAVRDFADERHQAGDELTMPGIWHNVAFSSQGLELLGAADLDAFPTDFLEGMHARAVAELDDDPAAMADWKVGGSADTEAHAILVLAADTAGNLTDGIDGHIRLLTDHEVDESAIHAERGQRLDGPGGERRHHEHFGFRDGISNPVIDPTKTTDPTISPEDWIAPGEFLLGHRDEVGRTWAGPDWARNGSFLVFRRLKQDAWAWREMLGRETAGRALSAEQLAAKLVGRWPSGARLSKSIQPDDPGPPPEPELTERREDFRGDQAGERVPRPAHIRKSHPRDLGSYSRYVAPRRHRLIRRAIPYGEPLDHAAREDDRADRGLLFLACAGSIERQFEFLHRNWFNNPDFRRPRDGLDPIVGRGAGPREVQFPGSGGTVSLDQFVTVTGGGYFFAPSIRALAYLADPIKGFEEDPNVTYPGGNGGDPGKMLGDFILEQFPYNQPTLPQRLSGNPSIDEVSIEGPLRNRTSDMELTVEQLKRELGRILESDYWYYQCEPRRVTKAIRIKVTYTLEGNTYTEHILIGFEGMGP